VPEAFFLPDGERFVATVHTRGPWSRDLQHGGPPAALLTRALERLPFEGPGRLTRVTIELLRPVPIGPVSVEAEVVRAGRTAQALEGRLLAGGKLALRATALRVRTTELDLARPPARGALPPPAQARPYVFPFFVEAEGYHVANEMRVARGEVGVGAMAVWMRMRVPLVPGEPPSPAQRVLLAGDSSNGISFALDPKAYTFVNPDLTVHLHRLPEGEWIGLDATTVPWPDGVGLAESALEDERGPIGRALQSLVVDAR
jgi:hypothetical protein